MAALQHHLSGSGLTGVEDKFRQRIDPRAVEKLECPQIQRQRRGVGIGGGGEHCKIGAYSSVPRSRKEPWQITVAVAAS